MSRSRIEEHDLLEAGGLARCVPLERIAEEFDVSVAEVRAWVDREAFLSRSEADELGCFGSPHRRWTIHPGNLLPVLGYVTLRNTMLERARRALEQL
jgi:hypothetical protein